MKDFYQLRIAFVFKSWKIFINRKLYLSSNHKIFDMNLEVCQNIIFLAQEDAQEVMLVMSVSQSVQWIMVPDFTEVTLVSEDAF